MGTNTSLIKWTKPTKKEQKNPKLLKYRSSSKTRKKQSRFQECAGPMHNMQDCIDIWVYCPVEYVHLKNYSFEEWIEFINILPFPCYYEEIRNVGWGSTGKKDCHVVRIETKDYPPKGSHLLAVHSLIRYSYSSLYTGIPNHVLTLYNEYGLDPMQALYLGHYAVECCDKYRGYYGLLRKASVRNREFIYPPSISGPTTLLREMKNINNSFDNKFRKKISASLNGKNYEKIIKEIGW